MSLQFVIDGYNIIKHPKFTRTNKKIEDARFALLEFIREKKLSGSPKNKVSVVFDGYPDSRHPGYNSKFEAIFTKKESADERIRRIVEYSGSPKNIVVVSDDREIKYFCRSFGARILGVEEFITRSEKSQPKDDSSKPELTYSQMHKINEELRKIWLKE